MEKREELGRLGNKNEFIQLDFDKSKIVKKSFPKDDFSQGKLKNLEESSKLGIHLFEKRGWNWDLKGSIGFWVNLNGAFLQYCSNRDPTLEGKSLIEHYEKAYEVYQNFIEIIEEGNYKLCYSDAGEYQVKIEPIN